MPRSLSHKFKFKKSLFTSIVITFVLLLSVYIGVQQVRNNSEIETTSAAVAPYDWGPFNPRQIPVEVQTWWTPVDANGYPIDGKGFGHIHAACKVPLGQTFPQGTETSKLELNCRVVLHNNPAKLTAFRIDVYNDPGKPVYTKKLDPPYSCFYDGGRGTQCTYLFSQTIDTASWKAGWHTLRIRATALTPDSKAWSTSSEIPINIRGGSTTDAPCTGGCLVGKSWYGDQAALNASSELGYHSAIIENAPNTIVKGVYTFKIKNFKSTGRRMIAFLDKSHLIQALPPYWPAEPQLAGKSVFDKAGDIQTSQSVSIDTRTLVNGWHSFSVRTIDDQGARSVCSYCTNDLHFQTGIAKIWFFVQN